MSEPMTARPVEVTTSRNGPYLVQGPITIVDADETPVTLPTGDAIALCRCGRSDTKPFCDGSHVAAGFDGTLDEAGSAR